MAPKWPPEKKKKMDTQKLPKVFKIAKNDLKCLNCPKTTQVAKNVGGGDGHKVKCSCEIRIKKRRLKLEIWGNCWHQNPKIWCFAGKTKK